MSLSFDLMANEIGKGQTKLGFVEIRRLTKNPERSLITQEILPNVVCTYEVFLDDKLVGEVDHRYGDGPWALTQRALILITFRPALRVNEEAIDPGPVITGTRWDDGTEEEA